MSNPDHPPPVYSENFAECPWCHHPAADSWELFIEGDLECGKCEKAFKYTKIVTIAFDCEPIITQKEES